MKIAGRDAGSYCLIVDQKDDRVLIDGQTRRRFVNPSHLEPLKKEAKLKKGASTEDVVKALGEFGITVVEPKKRPAKASKAKSAKKE